MMIRNLLLVLVTLSLSFSAVQAQEMSWRKYRKLAEQLEKEGAVQVFYNINAFKREPILAVVGQLQFDVVQARLQSEYNVTTELERMSHVLLRWIKGEDKDIEALANRSDAILARDSRNAWAMLFQTPFLLKYYSEKNPSLKFVELSDL